MVIIIIIISILIQGDSLSINYEGRLWEGPHNLVHKNLFFLEDLISFDLTGFSFTGFPLVVC